MPHRTRLDLRDRLLTPAVDDTHTHLAGSPLDTSLVEDVGRPQSQYSALPDVLPARGRRWAFDGGAVRSLDAGLGFVRSKTRRLGRRISLGDRPSGPCYVRPMVNQGDSPIVRPSDPAREASSRDA